MDAIRIIAATVVIAASAPASAQQAQHRLGDHPAVVVQRLHSQQGYDYAAKFYPHPAWLYLYAEAPAQHKPGPETVARERGDRAVPAGQAVRRVPVSGR